MKLFIRIRDGKPFEHPIFEDNFRAAFPDVDPENLPPEFARFTRTALPVQEVFKVYEGVTYESDGAGGWCDVHHVRDMTPEERQAKINEVQNELHPDGWVFNESLCCWVPPEQDTSMNGEPPNVID